MDMNKQIAGAFRAARARIKRRKNNFICIALLDSGHPLRSSAINIVQTRMAGAFTLSKWLVVHKVAPRIDDLDDALMREYRLRWLDALIQEFDPS